MGGLKLFRWLYELSNDFVRKNCLGIAEYWLK